jgi:hypothetical protein
VASLRLRCRIGHRKRKIRHDQNLPTGADAAIAPARRYVAQSGANAGVHASSRDDRVHQDV